ncbi:MAG TPA: FAD-dependent monooxygenase [Candidatus Sulfopaludibacter sp.]|nr:FAD-dependent monooxygenase [Candidatus Sulfopaludibacter sp.]
MTADVLVIGGGPAGLAAAIAARQRGFDVTLMDHSVPPIDKACGEGIMPDGIAAARLLGLELKSGAGYPFRGIRFCHGGRSVESVFPSGVGLGIRRTALHRLMVDRAAVAGVRMVWGARVGFVGDSVMLDGKAVPARWIVGADGGQSAVRAWAGLDASRRNSRRFGFRRHYRLALWTDFMELHWGQRCELYITPVGPQEICIALISGDQRLRLDEALRQFPGLVDRLRAAGTATLERGAISATRRLESVCRRRVALVGDASGSVDAVTGEGLCQLFQQAVALADAFAEDDLSRYAAAHRRIVRRPQFMADLMLMMDGRARLRRAVIATLSAHPRLFAGMVGFHVGRQLA